jgi:CheY-like chemotaxis protein
MNAIKVMVVDDEPSIGRLLSYQLHGFGYDVCYVQDGLQALERVLVERPDLILLDVVMPLVSGWDVCRELRGSSAVPIIMLTGKNADADIVAGLGAGADDYVTKPFSIAQLQARIEAVMRRAAGETQHTKRQAHGAASSRIAQRHSTAAYQSVEPAPRNPDQHSQSAFRTHAVAAATHVARSTPERITQTRAGAPDTHATPAQPQRLGPRMREARQRRGITLYQAERDTRVRWEFLQAIEQENWTYLPRQQLRPAVQAYSGFLGLDTREFDASLTRRPVNLHIPTALTLIVMLLVIVGLTLL